MTLERRTLSSIARLAAVVGVLMAGGGVISAHHSSANYSDQVVQMDGTVVEYRFRNPHVMVIFDTKNAAGEVVQWKGELSSVTTMISVGLMRDSLKAGDQVKFWVNLARDGAHESAIVKMTRPDGKVILGYAPRANNPIIANNPALPK